MFINQLSQSGFSTRGQATTLALGEEGGTLPNQRTIATNQAIRSFDELDRNGDGIASRNEVNQYKQELSQTKLLLEVLGGLIPGLDAVCERIQKRLDVATLFQKNYDRFAQANNDNVFSRSDIRRVANTDGDPATISQIDIENRVFNPNGSGLFGNRFLSQLLLPLLSLFTLFGGGGSAFGGLNRLDPFSSDVLESDDSGFESVDGSDFSDTFSDTFVDDNHNVSMFNQSGTNLFQSIGFGTV